MKKSGAVLRNINHNHMSPAVTQEMPRDYSDGFAMFGCRYLS